jgi:HEAT repeat protein
MGNQTTPPEDRSKLWIKQLQDPKPGKRDEALRELGELKDPQAIPAIVEILKNDRNDNTRKFAAAALKEIGHPDALEPLMQALEQEEKTFARKEIIAALERIGKKEAVPLLGRILNDGKEDLAVRFPAMVALQKIGGAESARELCRALGEGLPDNLRGRIVTVLGEMKSAEAAGKIGEILKGDKEESVRRAAVKALAGILGEKSIPQLAGALMDPQSPKVQARAAEQLGLLKSPLAIQPLCRAMLTSKDETMKETVLEGLKRIPDWKGKADHFIQILRGGNFQRADLPGKEIIVAIDLTPETVGADPHALTDYLIEKAVGQDRRMTENLSSLIVAACGGDPEAAGERLNSFQTAKSIPSEKMDPLRKHIGGESALGPVMQRLSDDLATHFRIPIKELNDRTQTNWNKTIEYAQYGFLARMVMSVIVFIVGIILLLVSSYQFMFGDLQGSDYFGVGVPFVSGVGTMLLIIYTGPLREIRQAVEDLGTASAAFIAYVHRVLQVSHTFSFLYLKQAMSFEEMKKSSDLIQGAMKDTVEKLAGRDYKAAEGIISDVLREMRASSEREEKGRAGGSIPAEKTAEDKKEEKPPKKKSDAAPGT